MVGSMCSRRSLFCGLPFGFVAVRTSVWFRPFVSSSAVSALLEGQSCLSGEPKSASRADIHSVIPIVKRKSEASVAKHFVDFKRVKTIAGNGGDGMRSFLSTIHQQFAGPDGGDGGCGGHVIFEADPDVKSLSHLNSVVKSKCGLDGASKSCHGASADHLVIKVPLGTVFTDVGVGQVVCDLKTTGGLFVAARGGGGGKGNQFYVANDNRAPTTVEIGGKGEEKVYDVELRIIAHAGLVGFPNAGKSSLLRAISRARPKVAAYPFTTLNPYVGMVEYEDYEQIAVADIPGLMPGAHKNFGLGCSFLRHIERCLCLFYVLDLSLSDPWQQLAELQFELEQYRPGLSKRPLAIVGNKIDLPQSQQNLQLLHQRTDMPVFPVSAKYQLGLPPLLTHLRNLYDNHKTEWS